MDIVRVGFYLSHKMFAVIFDIWKLWPAERMIKISSDKLSYFSREEKGYNCIYYNIILTPAWPTQSPGDKMSFSLHFYLVMKQRLVHCSPLFTLNWGLRCRLYWTLLCFINTVIWLRIRLLGAKLPSFRTIQVCRIRFSMLVVLFCPVPSCHHDVNIIISSVLSKFPPYWYFCNIVGVGKEI